LIITSASCVMPAAGQPVPTSSPVPIITSTAGQNDATNSAHAITPILMQDIEHLPGPIPTTNYDIRASVSMSDVVSASATAPIQTTITNNGNPFDAIFDKLRSAEIAFKAPPKMGYGETKQVRLLLSETISAPQLEQILQDTNNVTTNSVKVADIMEAHLVGDDFTISPVTPETTPISGQQLTEWKWDIKPKAFGKMPLHLSLNAHVTVDGEERTRSIKTFDTTIYVQVTGFRSVTIFFVNNWQWLWTTIIVPIVFWAWHKKRKVKKKKKH